jgi:hypothetical protein
MSKDEKVIRVKVALLELAKQLANVPTDERVEEHVADCARRPA